MKLNNYTRNYKWLTVAGIKNQQLECVGNGGKNVFAGFNARDVK